MIVRPSSRAFRPVRLAVAVLLLCAFAAAGIPAVAAPESPSRHATLECSLESSSTAVPLTGEFGYTAHVRLDEPASYVQTRLQVRYPTGKLVYQRTMVENSAPAGKLSYSFGRELDGLDLEPGSYPVLLSVTADVAGAAEEAEVEADLLVYDPKSEPVPVVIVARVHGEPLSDPSGRLGIDPASPRAEGPRADTDRVSTLVLQDPRASVVLSVPPVLLAEWKRLSGGYTLATGTVVPAESPVARTYADTLARLRAAIDTGRLELVSLGYSDPDLSALVQESLVTDIDAQYEAGVSACFASLEATPSTGTVPAGDCAPQQSLPYLAEQGVGYVVTSEACVGWGKAKPASGAYPVSGTELTALVTDDRSGTAMASGDASVALQRAFKKLAAEGRRPGPFAVRIDLGPGRPDATSTVVAATSAFLGERWTRLTVGKNVRPLAKAAAVTLAEAPRKSGVPAGYWKQVRLARAYAKALLAALGPGGPGVTSSQTDSLLAEASAWSEPEGSWGGAARGRGFADTSLGVSKEGFGDVSISAEPVTFAGKRGDLPVSIKNTTRNTLKVVVRAAASGDARVEGEPRIETVLRPQETFVQIPVDMRSALSSKLKVEVLAGEVVLARTTVQVQASYLDRIAIITGIVLLLTGLLVFIVRRVRSAEAAAGLRGDRQRDTVSSNERYTGDDDESEEVGGGDGS